MQAAKSSRVNLPGTVTRSETESAAKIEPVAQARPVNPRTPGALFAQATKIAPNFIGFFSGVESFMAALAAPEFKLSPIFRAIANSVISAE
jgi:hypothetical protein